MNTPTVPLSTTLSVHVDALKQADAGAALQADAAQQRLVAVLTQRNAVARARGGHRIIWTAVAATCVAVTIAVLIPLFGDRSSTAFAAALQSLREFSTLSMTIETTVDGHDLMPADRVLIDQAGDTRTEMPGVTTVIVNRRSGQVLILQQPAHRAIRYSIPPGGATAPARNLAWLDAVRSFRGHAKQLPGTRKLDGVIVRGWEMDAAAMRIVLWADADGVPREVDVTGAASMQQHMTLTLNAPLAPELFSTKLPAGYALLGPGG